jgi:osomolarity two-component system sensor histidine kinase NIK1
MKENLSILLVEDNILNQRITTFSLKKFNHEVDIANNGLEAVNKYREKEYDVILMDIMMPVMDGLEATFQIRKYEKETIDHKHTPVIAITANTLDNDRDKCLATGMDEYMAKPFDMNRLNEIFKELNILA